MTAQTEQIAAATCGHEVQFYRHDAELIASVGGKLAAALEQGAAAVAIATPEHRLGFERELERRGVDPNGRLTLLDASVTLDRLRVGGRVAPQAFRRVIGAVVRDAARAGGPVWAYGEMVALLWADGDVAEALELERLWNELGSELDFFLLCAYPSSIATEPGRADASDGVCRLHTAVAPSRDDRRALVINGFEPSLDAPRRARQFVEEVLREQGDARLIEDAVLIVSELATNAVVHAHTRFEVALHFQPRMLTMSVSDASPEPAAIGDSVAQAAAGRGLLVVDALASHWGCAQAPAGQTHAGKTVWVELAR